MTAKSDVVREVFSTICLGLAYSADSVDSFHSQKLISEWFGNETTRFHRVKLQRVCCPNPQVSISHKSQSHFFFFIRTDKYLCSVKHRNRLTHRLNHNHTLGVPLNRLITPSQSHEIHVKTSNLAGASWSFGMVAPYLTPCMDARQRSPAHPWKVSLPTWHGLHSHGSLFQPN